MAAFKPNLQTRCLVKQVEALQERMLQEFAEIRAVQCKWDVVDSICAQLEALDVKLTEQAARLDKMQMKVKLSCDAIGRDQQRTPCHAQGGKQPQGSGSGESASPTASELSDGILGAPPVLLTQRPPPIRYPLIHVRE
ncbi:3-ketoacyl-CoA synthase 11 [Hordeum vulgare]|nr:3-ketoacyl-CoA synthase 11 [Hordeum vulgare]